ncbi:isotrichodermin C-15 hydroxylase [Durotheca rogersii]|uniref:isotrichodermin C-15 hydroxylase n=1 Tax=Durotheca rogersii TaxID=419775 RepID=UPI002220F1A5|nr:isotrichodermin C-15 hydroxylase [Durotheca rogersii]KAI5861520.1 isotrichodermin C-15 hydroxylase [Durotheca rogersii]
MGLLGSIGFAAIAGALLIGTALYIAGNIFYNLYLHPLASFPGPLLRRATRLSWTVALLRGRIVFDSVRIHNKYGPVVRVAPDELAFLDPRAWRDIMGGGASEIPKWRGMYGVPAFLPPHIQNTIDKDYHRSLRRTLAPGFSDASLRAQEPMMIKYVDLLMQRLREKCADGPINLELWFRYVVFDIICDLTVGESFRCLESDGLHPWIMAMIDGGKPMGFLTAINMYPALTALLNPILGISARGLVHILNEMVKPMVEKRLAVGERPDLINPLVRLQNGGESSMSDLIINTNVIVGAGAETSAGALTAVASLLIDNPDRLAKLQSEVRSAFEDESQITAEAVSRLPYLVACLDEAMRLFPQTGSPSLRLTDRDTIIAGVHVPKNTVVGVWPWAMYRTPTLWTEPNEFRPERFTGDPKYANDVREAFKPFFTGSRDCIGQNLALIEMRLILARMVFNFNMKRSNDPNSHNWISKQKNAFIVWDKTPLPVQLTPVRQ